MKCNKQKLINCSKEKRDPLVRIGEKFRTKNGGHVYGDEIIVIKGVENPHSTDGFVYFDTKEKIHRRKYNHTARIWWILEMCVKIGDSELEVGGTCKHCGVKGVCSKMLNYHRMAKCMRDKNSMEILDDAIAHLGGYCVMVEAQTGFPALAVKENIEGLKQLKEAIKGLK